MVIVGCTELESPASPEPLALWEARLAPVSAPDPDAPIVSGRAAAAVTRQQTRVGVGLDGVDTELFWGVHRAPCEAPADLLETRNSYPALGPDRTEVETVLSLELDPDDRYSVRVGTDPEPASVIACGELNELDDV